MRLISYSSNLCAVCGHTSTGFHFGAITCRACAAFFRRSWNSKRTKQCKKEDGKCLIVTSNGFFSCKKCRLQKCLDVGMVMERTQETVDDQIIVASKDSIPPTVDTVLGHPNFILFTSKPRPFHDRPKNIVDVQFLMRKAMSILEQGTATPIHSKNTLGKLALGLGRVKETFVIKDIRAMTVFRKEDTLAQWEYEFLRLVHWLTYFDEFRLLPKCLQLSMAKSVWSVWNRLLFLFEAVAKCKEQFGEVETKRMARDTVVFDWSHVEFDMSWCSNYPIEQIRFFLDIPSQFKISELTRMMAVLDPTDVELSYMLCQISFHYISKRHEDGIQNLIEKFQEKLANDLHQYYVEELGKPCYSERLISMMKINNALQSKIRENKTKIELSVALDIVNCECSHPDMFLDIC